MDNALSAQPALLEKCQNNTQLRTWVQTHLNLKFPSAGVCAGHCSPFEYLSKAYFEPAKDLIVWAPRGGGKTRLGAAATLLDLLHKPGIAIRILGGSLEQSLRMWEHLLPDLEEHAADLIEGKLLNRRARLKSGSIVGVVAQSERAVRGLRVQKLRCDEVDEFTPAIWQAAQLVTRSRPATGQQDAITATVEALSTMHHPGGLMEQIVDNAPARGITVLKWCLLDVLQKCPAERDCHTCPLHNDCGGIAKKKCDGFLSIDDAIRLKARVSLETWEAEMLCRRPSAQLAVFAQFNPDVHVVEQMPADHEFTQSEWHLGIDFGYVNPFVCLWIRRDSQGRSHVMDEYTASFTQMPQHIIEIKSRTRWPATRVGCDPSGSAKCEQTGLSNVDLLRQAGFHVRTKGSSIQTGIEIIRAALRPAIGQPTLFIHPRCTQLIAALKAYRYPQGRSETPIKDGPDHLIDALRYYFINATRCLVQTRPY